MRDRCTDGDRHHLGHPVGIGVDHCAEGIEYDVETGSSKSVDRSGDMRARLPVNKRLNRELHSCHGPDARCWSMSPRHRHEVGGCSTVAQRHAAVR